MRRKGATCGCGVLLAILMHRNCVPGKRSKALDCETMTLGMCVIRLILKDAARARAIRQRLTSEVPRIETAPPRMMPRGVLRETGEEVRSWYPLCAIPVRLLPNGELVFGAS